MAFAAQQQVTTQVQSVAKPLKTADADVDLHARVGVERVDASDTVAAMLDSSSCKHAGKFYYNIDAYGQLSLVERMNCQTGPKANPVSFPSTASAFICQLDANLQCDNRLSQQIINKVAYGRNIYAATSAGMVVGKTRYSWLDAAGAAYALPLIQASAAQQIAAYQKIFGKH